MLSGRRCPGATAEEDVELTEFSDEIEDGL
jgi:hypothetical protein